MQEWLGCVSLPIPFIMNPILDKEDFQHYFTPKRRLFIALAPRMTIKFQIHAIHTAKGRTTTLHYKRFKNNLPIEFFWEDLDFFSPQIALGSILQVIW
jgi:hypothetical protein